MEKGLAMSRSNRGALVVVEGLDRADRTTSIGKSIDAYLKGDAHQDDHAIHLLFSANRWEAAAQMRADIEAGISIVIDRYYYSGVVYSAAKGNADLTLQWAREPEVGLPRPDICLFLDIEPDVASQRGGFGDEKYETSQMQKLVRQYFHRLLKQSDGEDMVLVDAARSLEDVQQDMRTLIEMTFQDKKMSQPLRKVLPYK